MRVPGGAVLLGLTLALGTAAPAGAVVGGAPAVNQQFPWVVRLSVGCDGALVADRVVLTAAHCVDDGSAVRVRAGSADLHTTVTAGAIQFVMPNGYRRGSGTDDWALIQLDRRLSVPTLALTPSSAADAGPFTVVGWGATREEGPQQRYLRYATVPAVSGGTCGAVYRSSGFVAPDMICAGNLRTGGVDTCQGDSGGPLLYQDSAGRWSQVGIVSWGYGCGRAGYPGVYTRVSAFLRQIRAEMAALD